MAKEELENPEIDPFFVKQLNIDKLNREERDAVYEDQLLIGQDGVANAESVY